MLDRLVHVACVLLVTLAVALAASPRAAAGVQTPAQSPEATANPTMTPVRTIVIATPDMGYPAPDPGTRTSVPAYPPPYPGPGYPAPDPIPTCVPEPEPYPGPCLPRPLPTYTLPSYPPPQATGVAETTSPTPTSPSTRAPAQRAGFVTVVLRPSPNTSFRPGGTLAFSIVATNRGQGAVRDATVAMPLDPAQVRVMDATFSREGPWVSALGSTNIEMRTGPLAPGDAVTATLRLASVPTIKHGANLAAWLTFAWDDSRGGGSGRSNTSVLIAAEHDNHRELYPLIMHMVDGTFAVTSTLFAPGEPVALWYATTGGRTVALSSVTADPEGTIREEFSVPTGSDDLHSVAAHGLWTGFTAAETAKAR